ncbi:MAG: TfoX/Sxy family protein [Planctomycetes bacterium]|nr:TfoX/Sxy family protein [Planctomycetota bacterium]
MAYDEKLADRTRSALKGVKGLAEIKMFGGLCFTVNGNMVCGIVDDKLMLRVGKDNYDAALKLKHVEPMTFTGKPMKSMVYVTPAACKTPAAVKPWVKRALDFAKTLPPK